MDRLSRHWNGTVAKTRLAVLVLLHIVLIGCASEEFRFEERACAIKFLEEIPPMYETQRVTRFRTEDRLTGRRQCVFDEKHQKTICRPVFMTVQVPYTAIVEVDRNERQRTLQIEQCTANACMEKHGNLSCEVGK